MSWQPAETAEANTQIACPAVDTVIVPRAHDIGGFEVRRALPSKRRQMVGPFIFFDQMGPGEFLTGKGLDVRPHPHIGLATVTWVLDGEIMHRDSLGSVQPIRPGEVNWMTAGRGIVHSERSPDSERQKTSSLYGLQTWLALPKAHEETEPDFAHFTAGELPVIEDTGLRAVMVAGSGWGKKSPVAVFSDTLYADATMKAGAVLPLPDEHEERAVYVLAGTIEIAGDTFEPGAMLVLHPGDGIAVKALTDAHVVALGGATMDGPRHLWWNLVSSSKERIEQAKADWKAGRFKMVEGDDEFIPLPEN